MLKERKNKKQKMRKETDDVFAFKELDESEGKWNIYFDPCPRLDGLFYYSCLEGFIDGSDADLIVEMLINNKDKFNE